MNLNTDRIARSMTLRRNPPSCHAVMTAGIAALGPEAVARIVKTIAVYDDFCHANDPDGEHDFGSFEADGHMIFFRLIISILVDRAFPLFVRPSRHRARHHHHAGRGVLSRRGPKLALLQVPGFGHRAPDTRSA